MPFSRGLQISISQAKLCVRICVVHLEPHVRTRLLSVITQHSADEQAVRMVLLRVAALSAYSARLRIDTNTPLCRKSRDHLDVLIALVERQSRSEKADG